MGGKSFAPRPNPEGPKGQARFEVRGQDPQKWAACRPLFVTRIRDLVDELAVLTGNAYFQSKADELTTPILAEAIEQLRVQAPTPEQTAAFERVVASFASRPKRVQEPSGKQPTKAQARTEEIAAAARQLVNLLTTTRVCLGPEGEVLIGSNIEALVDLVKTVVGR